MSSDSSQLRHDTPSALHTGTRLGEYELLRLLGVGGFGIVYLAFDHALEREVAIKEYMPASLAGRTETMHVSIRSQSDAESFALGLKSFVNEAKLLARFDHPSLLKVHRFWEANGTAYMAMPVLRGRTLKETRAEMAVAPDEAQTRQLLVPLLGAIERLHREGVYHRDIAPDNIQIEPDGRPVLLDFGAARRVLSDKSQALTAILKPAYAPIEQYGEAGAVKQGPWTDLYALGATLHYLLLNRPPPPATARTVHDEPSALTTDNLPGCSETFLHTIDWMLCPRPTDRPQSVAELRDVLEGRARLPVRRQAEAPPMHWERTSVLAPDVQTGRIDLDVGHEATQFIAPPPSGTTEPVSSTTEPVSSTTEPVSSTTEHVWVDPLSRAEVTAVYTRPPAAATPAAALPDELEMRAQRHEAPPKKTSALPAVLGGLLLVAAAAGAWFWQQTRAVPTPAATLPAPAVVASPSPPAAVPAAVTVPAMRGADAAASAAAPAAGASAPAAAEAAVPAVVMPVSEPVRAVEVPVKPRAERPPPAARPVARANAEAPRLRPAPAVPPPATEAATPSAGPPPNCGSREGVRYLICMERECGRSEFAGHPACQRWKQ